MLGAIRPGAPAYVSEATGQGKLRWSLEALFVDGTWIGVHPVRANRVVEEGLASGDIVPLRGYTAWSREPKLDAESRADFLLTREGRVSCWVEVKNVTLAHRGLALFPDSVTERGRRHLRALEHRVAEGDRAVLLLVASRSDVTGWDRPTASIEPTEKRSDGRGRPGSRSTATGCGSAAAASGSTAASRSSRGRTPSSRSVAGSGRDGRVVSGERPT